MLTEFLLSLFIPFVGLTQGAEAKMTNQSEQGQKFEGVYKGGKRTPLSPVEEALRNLKIKEESAKFHMQMCYDALQKAERANLPLKIAENLKANPRKANTGHATFGENVFVVGTDGLMDLIEQFGNELEKNLNDESYVNWVDENREKLEKAANASAEYAKTVCEEAKLASDKVEEARDILRRAVHNFMRFMNFIARNN